ncbi:MAG TPA: polysaccharide biosynthesis tyrosine autokinase [Bryobacteraceae bacterium]|nr:polysaccharide biosynthesis tyrosine autokinase [Bryobacteraceae bacterium]
MEYWQLLKQRKLLIFIGAVVGAITAFVMLLNQQPIYGSSTTLEIQALNESFMNMNAVDPLAGQGSSITSPSNINTQLKIIESGSIRAAVFDRLRRETAPMSPPTGGDLGRLRARIHHTQDDPLVEMRNALAIAFGTLRARPVVGTRIISIATDSTIPEVASNFVNSIAAEYIAQNAQQRSVNYQRTAQWLDTQVEETKVKLEQAENALQQFTQQSGGAFVADEKDTLADSKLKALQGDLASIQADRIAKQVRYEQVKASPADAMPDAVEDFTFKSYQSKLAEFKDDLAKASLRFTPANPKIQQIQQQINDTMAAMQKEKQLTLDRIKNDYETAMEREKKLQSAYMTQAGIITAQTGKVSQYTQLKREVELYRQTLNSMLNQANQVAVVSAVPTNNIRVIDAAGPASIPYKPKAKDFEIYGVFLGCAGGIALSIAIDKFSKWRKSLTFAAPGHAPGILNVPELGVIPSAAVDLLPRENGSRWKWKRLPAAARDPLEEPKAVELEIAKRKQSFLAESFRMTLTSILLMSRRGLQPRILIVTSPNKGEGKTTIASNMAIAIAETGRKVLLIDADLRNPQLHTIFGVERKPGLADMIGHSNGNGTAKHSPWVCETQIAGAFLIPAGSTETNLSQVFHSVEIPVLLKKLTEQFDVILIDTPPVLQFSDARLMSRFADGVVLVVRSGVTGCESAVTAREQLAQDNIEVLGTILNDWDVRGSKKHPYHSYYSAYTKNPNSPVQS